MNQTLEIALWHSGPSTHLMCTGEIDITTAGDLERALAMVIETTPTALFLHGENISLLTSAGIDVLERTARECRRRSIEFRPRLSDHARKVLDMLGLQWIYDDRGDFAFPLSVEEALASVSRID